MLVSLPSWLEPYPFVEAVFLELPPPSLDDNTGDADRLTRGLRQRGFHPVTVRPEQMNRLSQRLREGCFQVTAVLGYYQCHWELLDVLAGHPTGPLPAMAVDLGSSRLGLYLLDLRERKVLAQDSVVNPQIPYGEDILSRIVFCRREENLKLLQKVVLEAINSCGRRMLEEAGCPGSELYAVSIAGNTTMSHLLLGLDPSNLCREPYIPVANRYPVLSAEQLRLSVHPLAPVYIFPNVGSYFGGDLIADILAVGLHRTEEMTMLVDVGTNAEVVLGNSDWLVGCAGAAGPALEGGVVERGKMAAPGAIDWVRIDRETWEPTYRVLGGGKPDGICGSGLIDLVAEMFMSGILSVQGKINTRRRSPRVVETPDGMAYRLVLGSDTADGRDLLISEIDIGIFLKSKAAMYTILNVITRKVGLGFEDFGKIFIAGAFGNRIDPQMAIKIGMIPDLPPGTYQGLQDTVGCGAAMVLLDRRLLDEVEKVCGRITYVELNVNVELMNDFRGALFLPHTDPRLFPSVSIPEQG